MEIDGEKMFPNKNIFSSRNKKKDIIKNIEPPAELSQERKLSSFSGTYCL